MVTKPSWNLVLSLLVYLALFLFLLFPYSDYDWGWHYRYGQYLLSQGHILRQDIFSWTMQGYQWINHSWLYDPILYLAFNSVGFLGLTLAGAIISFLTFFVSIKQFGLSYWQKVFLAVIFVELTYGVIWEGLRSQVLALLFLSILVSVLLKALNAKKALWFLPLLFLIWANLHGTFTLGLIIFTIFLTSLSLLQIISNKFKLFNLKYWFIFYGLSIAVTFLNPFTYHVYLEALKHSNNPWLSSVSEWQPIEFSLSCIPCNLYIFYTLFLIIAFILRRKITDLPFIAVTGFLLYLVFGARRYLAIYTVATLPMMALMLKEFNWNLDKFKVTKYVFLVLVIIYIELGIFNRFPQYNFLAYTYTDYCKNSTDCSEGLTSYLLKNPPNGRGFNIYNWGGYLIGRGVLDRTFIDGRMHLWEKEGYMPFADFMKMYYQKDFERFKKYDFDFIIDRNKSDLTQKIQSSGELGNWELRYSDNLSSYFVKKR